MNKIKRNIGKIVLGCIILGILLMTIGFFMGAKMGVYLDQTGAHIVEYKEYKIKESDLSSFENLTIDIPYIDIEIIPSDKYGIDICYQESQNPVQWKMEDGSLKISDNEQSKLKFINSDFSFLMGDNRKSYIKVYLPNETELEDIKINTNSGNVKITNCNTKALEIKNLYGKTKIDNITTNNIKVVANSGDFTCENSKAKKVSIGNNYGKVTLKNSTLNTLTMIMESGESILKDIIMQETDIKNEYGIVQGSHIKGEKTKIDTNSGEIHIEGELLGETNIFSKYGRIDLNLNKEKEYYACDFSTNYGKIVLDHENLKERLSFVTHPEEGKILKVNAGSGDIRVNFKK